MNIYEAVNSAFSEVPELDRPDASTYLGPIIKRVPNLSVRMASDSLSWRKQESDLLPRGFGPLYLPDDFEALGELLLFHPLIKSGMKVDPQQNLDFLKAEAENWLSIEKMDSKALYKKMWDEVPNISQYANVAYSRIEDLVSKLPSLLNLLPDSKSRSFELRFPTEYCPVVWSFVLSPGMKSLEASMVFRSVEVSRNLLNDLYLFYVYFGYVFTLYKEKMLFDIDITAFNIYAQDAHIIDFS